MRENSFALVKMADLDDFFAKKDKKKSKTKKFLTQDELREKLEDNSKKAAAEPVKPKFQEENGSGNITENKSNDDEVSLIFLENFNFQIY